MKTINIIHIEDDPRDAGLVARELTKADISFTQTIVSSKAEFLSGLDACKPDIILSDHSLPAFNSIEALKIVKNNGMDIPFILVTGNTSEEFAVSVMKAGANDYILKDRIKRLPLAINNALYKFEMEREREKLTKEKIERQKVENDEVNKIARKLQLAAKSAQMGIWDWDIIHNHLNWDACMCRLYGISASGIEFVYDDWLFRIHALDRQRIDENIQAAIAGKKEYNTEFRILWDDDSLRHIRATGIVERDQNGNAISMTGVNWDITGQKNDEEKIKESELRYRSLIEQATDAICIADSSLKFIDINPVASQMFGYSKEEVLQFSLTDILFEEDLETNKLKIDEVKSGETVRNERRLKRKDGTVIVMEVSTRMLRDGSYIMFGHDVTQRKEAEDKIITTSGSLQHALNDLNKIMNSSLDIICTINEEGKFVKVSAASEWNWGYKPSELVGKKFMDLVFHEDVEKTKNIDAKITDGLLVQTFENRYIHKDGRIIHMLWSSRWDENDKLTYCVAKDVTEKKNLENLLYKANTLARIGSWDVDLLNNTVYWSDVTREIHEADIDFIPDLQTGINFYKGRESRKIITQKVQDAIEKGIPWDIELEIITARGNEKWIRTMGETEFVNGKCVKLYGSFQDIDTLKRAELAATEALREKNSILDSIGDAFYALDKNWTVTYWNSQAEKVTGRSKNEIIGHNFWEVFADEMNSPLHTYFHKAIQENKVQHFELNYKTANPWYAVSVYPSLNGLSVFFRDVTERKLSQISLNELNENLQKNLQELAISNTELEQFAFVASHDLQEPLRMVTSFLTQIEKKYGDIIDDKGKKYIDFALDGAKRMRRIILDLLEFSKVGRKEDKQEYVDMNELVSEIQILFRKHIKEKKATIIVDKLPQINTYRLLMRQVLQNLVSNALKYSNKSIPVQIHISAKELKDHWQFSLADNGIGIEKEYFDKIFIIFQRLHNKDDFSGTGMGLAITKKIMENLGGKIWVESELGKGSTFYFTLLKQLT